MNNGTIELLSPVKISQSPYRKKLVDANIRGGWNYALDHTWLYENIDQYIKKNTAVQFPVTLDIGCGNGMLHTFLESELHIGVIGIDRVFGLCPYDSRDPRMDLCIDFTKENTFFKNNVDIIYWCSSIEHNEPEQQKICVQKSLEALKPGGLFLATFGYSKTSNFFKPSDQYNLSEKDAENVFNCKWKQKPDFDAMVSEYKKDLMEIDSKHTKRYGTSEYSFLVAGVSIIKK